MRLLAVHGLGHDTGACIYDGTRLVAAIETERLTRVRHDHRASLAVDFVLADAGLAATDIDLLACSTNLSRTLTRIPDVDAVQRRIERGVLHVETRSEMLGPPLPCVVVAHEASHAAAAFHVAGWPEGGLALVNEGRGTFSRNALLRYGQRSMQLVDRDPLPWYGTGFGWSALGYLLGLGAAPSVAGRVMALSGYGTASTAHTELLESIDADLHHATRERQREHLRPLLGFLDDHPDFSSRADLVGGFQRLFTRTVADYCRRQLPQGSSGALALSGGCALNLDANTVIRRDVAPGVVVPPHCNDAGQPLGAAVYALQICLGVQPEPFDVYRCGPPLQAAEAGGSSGNGGLHVRDADAWGVASRLAAGEVVALAHGRAELGPRALGHRSLLASASVPGMRRRVSERIKQREWFRPLACVMRTEAFAEVFPGAPPSPHMLFNYTMPSGLAPEATHVDGTSRVQTVGRADEPLLHEILAAYEQQTGERALINTSLNAAGRAIAQTTGDVLDDFLDSDVDTFVVDGLMLSRTA